MFGASKLVFYFLLLSSCNWNTTKPSKIDNNYIESQRQDSIFNIAHHNFVLGNYKASNEQFKYFIATCDSQKLDIFAGAFLALTESRIGNDEKGLSILKNYYERYDKEKTDTVFAEYYAERLYYLRNWIAVFPEVPIELKSENGFLLKTKYCEISGGYRNILQYVVYPEIVKRSGVDGVVVLRVLIDKYGKPKKIFVAKSPDKLLTSSSINASLKVSYQPTNLHGILISEIINIPIAFRLR